MYRLMSADEPKREKREGEAASLARSPLLRHGDETSLSIVLHHHHHHRHQLLFSAWSLLMVIQC